MPPESPAPAPQPEQPREILAAPPAPTPDSAPPAPAVDAAPAPLANASPRHDTVHTHCENCGTALRGHYCHACGQHDFDSQRAFRHTALEALENFFHFDAKFFRNLFTLLFRPGELTAEFNAGKRAAQMPPFRLYLFVSVLFFFASFVGQDAGSAGVKVVPGLSVTFTESSANSLERVMTEKGGRALADPRGFRDAFLHAVPKMILVCLPLFALYTRALFRRAAPHYLQHLILALHFQTFLFLFVLTRNGWIGLADFAHLGGVVRFAANLWLIVYPVLMLRRLFGESWLRTLLKTAVLGIAFGLTLLVAFLTTVFTLFLLV